MTNDSEGVTPPEGLPDQIISDLNELTNTELRKAIVHAQELLQVRGEDSLPIEPGPGEDIIRVTEHEGYTEVVKKVPCAEGCEDCPHGPYLYHIKEEPSLDGGEKLHWTFIGKVNPDD